MQGLRLSTAMTYGRPVLAKQGFGVVPETSNAYHDLTAWQNLMMMGGSYGLPRARAAQRSSDLLGMVGLLERKDQKVQHIQRNETAAYPCDGAHP